MDHSEQSARKMGKTEPHQKINIFENDGSSFLSENMKGDKKAQFFPLESLETFEIRLTSDSIHGIESAQLKSQQLEKKERNISPTTLPNKTHCIDRERQDLSRSINNGGGSFSDELITHQLSVIDFHSLQSLNLKKISFSYKAVKILSHSDFLLKNLKVLDLSENPIGNNGIKFLSDTSSWTFLQILILIDTHIDYQGAKYLALNDSWINLKELDLSQNQRVGNLGAANLSMNRSWTRLQKLSLRNCNCEKAEIRLLFQRNKNFSVCLAEDATMEEDQDAEKYLRNRSKQNSINYQQHISPKFPLLNENIQKKLKKGSSTTDGNSKYRSEYQHYMANSSRGGCTQGKNAANSDYATLLTKFNHYREKILNNASLKEELSLYIEARATPGSSQEPVELVFDLHKHFLGDEITDNPKVLLLTSLAGGGKSLFCKHLMKELLSDWNDPQHQEPNEKLWFPIFIELDSLKNPQLEAISETLARDLALTNEEIKLLQASEESSLPLPRLLFIFDGYDSIQDVFINATESENRNLYMSNRIGTSWKQAKVIVTCREEHLLDVKLRDVLFAPITGEGNETFSVPGSFLERKMELFTHEQITCYLRKYCVLHQIADLDEDKTKPSGIIPFKEEQKAVIEPESSSWSIVKKLETVIFECRLGGIAKNPFILWILANILPDIAAERIKLGNKAYQLKVLSTRAIIERFVNKILKSASEKRVTSLEKSENSIENVTSAEVKEQEAKYLLVRLHMGRFRHQAQAFALKSSGYSIKHITHMAELEENDAALLELHPIFKWEDKLSKVRLSSQLFVDFFAAESIQEEVAAFGDGILSISEELLLNQKLLTKKPLFSNIILFLTLAVKDEKLTTNNFLSLIMSSRQSQKEPMPQKNTNSSSEPDLSVLSAIAANSLTILNAAGYNCSQLDFSNICLSGAYLCHGVFEGTNFMNADLKGANFAGADLKDASFLLANMENVGFGDVSGLRLEHDKIKNIAFSPNGKYFAADVNFETVIYEVFNETRFYFKEIRRVPGHFQRVGGSPFSANGKHILTILKKKKLEKNDEIESDDESFSEEEDEDEEDLDTFSSSFRVWDVDSGRSIYQFEVPNTSTIVNVDLDKKAIFFYQDRLFLKYHLDTGIWDTFAALLTKKSYMTWLNPVKWDFSRKENVVILVKDRKDETNLRCSITGKLIRKITHAPSFGEFSCDGRQIVSKTKSGVFRITDTLRGHMIKSDIYPEFGISEDVYRFSFNFNGTVLISETDYAIKLRDLANGSVFTRISWKINSKERNYCIDPNGKKIAYIADKHIIAFQDISDMNNDLTKFRIGSWNHKGLILDGTVVNGCVGLSTENLTLFREKGNYSKFSDGMLEKLFPQTPEVSEEVKNVILADRELEPTHGKVIGSELRWVNLQKLNLSNNKIGDESGAVIGSNKSWAKLEELVLSHTEIGEKTVKAIAENSCWVNLKKLQLVSNKIADIGAMAIGKSNIWTQLEYLNLQRNEIGDIGARYIGDNTCWKNLKVLALCFNRIGDSGAKAIAMNETWVKLEKFFFNSNKVKDRSTIALFCSHKTWKELRILELYDNPVEGLDANAFQVTEVVHSTKLSVLDLPQAKFDRDLLHYLACPSPKEIKEISLTDKGSTDLNAVAIGSNLTWINLKKLDLSFNQIGDEGGMKIGSNTTWVNLEELCLKDNNLAIKSSVAIGKNKTWRKLKVLDLSGNKLGNSGASNLAQNTTWTNLTTLSLDANDIGPKGAEDLSKNGTWTNLRILCLDCNKIGPEGAEKLRLNQSWTSLRVFNLGSNGLGSEGAFELRNKTWTNVLALNLRSNLIGVEGASFLRKYAILPYLQKLDLQNNALGSKGVEKLSKNTTWTGLRMLNLSDNSIDDGGAEALGRNKAWRKLQTLDLHSNLIGDKGIIGLVIHQSWTKLKVLDLSWNRIGPLGTDYISKEWSELEALDLQSNRIGDKGAENLSNNHVWAELHTLNLSDNNISEEGADYLRKNRYWRKLKDLRY